MGDPFLLSFMILIAMPKRYLLPEIIMIDTRYSKFFALKNYEANHLWVSLSKRGSYLQRKKQSDFENLSRSIESCDNVQD